MAAKDPRIYRQNPDPGKAKICNFYPDGFLGFLGDFYPDLPEASQDGRFLSGSGIRPIQKPGNDQNCANLRQKCVSGELKQFQAVLEVDLTCILAYIHIVSITLLVY